jgi:hypothetical protein
LFLVGVKERLALSLRDPVLGLRIEKVFGVRGFISNSRRPSGCSIRR